MNMRDSTPALAMLRRSLEEAMHPQTVGQILARRGLNAHYQPIVQLRNGAVIGHESLIRGPVDSPLRLPDALFKAAHTEGLSFELELACVQEGLRSWVLHQPDKRLFLNLSASALVKAVERTSISGFLKTLQAVDVSPAALVVEITEHERITEIPRLIEVAQALRSQGLRFALDDFGDGRSSLRLWAELRPEIVKIDRFFVHGLHDEAFKVQTLKGLSRFAETFGTVLLAEGIETEAELEIVRDLGVELGQGYFPVSYTHLDVYKRQVDDRALVLGPPHGGAFVGGAPERRALDRRAARVMGVDLDHPAEAVDLVGVPGGIEAFVMLVPAVAHRVALAQAPAGLVRVGPVGALEVVDEVLFAGQVGAPWRDATGTVVQRAEHAAARGVGCGLHQAVTRRRPGHRDGRVGRDAACPGAGFCLLYTSKSAAEARSH